MTSKPARLSPLAVIFITIFVNLLSLGMILPSLPFFAESLGASIFLIGLLSTTSSLMSFLFSPFWGWISDRIGRRPALLIGLAGTSLAYLFFGMSQSLPWLFCARAAAGIVGSASIPVAYAYIADITDPESRARGMGVIGAAMGLGFVFGPAIGGVLSRFGYEVPILAAAVLAAANLLWAWFRVPETHTVKADGGKSRSYLSPIVLKLAFRNRALLFLLILAFFSMIAFSKMEATYALFCEHHIGLDAVHVGWLLSEMGIISAIIQGLLIGRLTRKFGEVRLLQAGVLLMSIGLMLTAGTSSLMGLALIMPFSAVGWALMFPSMNALVSRTAAEGLQGMTLGLTSGVNSLGRVFGPPMGTALFQWYSPVIPYLTAGILLLAVFGLALWRLNHVIRGMESAR